MCVAWVKRRQTGEGCPLLIGLSLDSAPDSLPPSSSPLEMLRPRAMHEYPNDMMAPISETHPASIIR